MTYEKFQAMLLNNNMDILVYNLYYKNHFRFFSLILNTTYASTNNNANSSFTPCLGPHHSQQLHADTNKLESILLNASHSHKLVSPIKLIEINVTCKIKIKI